MRLSEKRYVEDPVLRHCKKHWPLLECKKMNGIGQKDWPDRMFCIPGGSPFFIEFKSPGEEPTPKQAHMIAKLRRQGYDVEVHDDKKTAIEAITKRLGGVALELLIGEPPGRAQGKEARQVEATRLPKEGDQVRNRAYGRRAVPRPRSR